jgi:hypothetical protein
LVLNEFCLLFLFSSFTLSSFFFISNFHLIDHLRRRRGREMEQLESGGGAAVHSIPKGNLFSGGFDGWWLEARGTSIRRRRGWK